MTRNFVSIKDFDASQLLAMIQQAIAEKKTFRAGKLKASLSGKTLAMIFEKPSLRTRVSFEAAMTELGGHAIYLMRSDIGLGSREDIRDIARVLGRMCDAILARTFSHGTVERLAEYASVPVINALSEHSHPCQAMADLMTAAELFGELGGRVLAFVGDGNNVARSLSTACAKLGMKFTLACPEGYGLPELSASSPFGSGGRCTICHDPAEAVADADIIYTDTWVSMGKEQESRKRLRDFVGFQVNSDLLAKAPDSAIVMHCLPAHRGREITDDVFEAHAETIFEEAENRLHFQRTLLNMLISKGGIE
ncbi:MAG: ornithine carbamoyltransferase [Planctomycetota bacterium]|jgi:ornithine carbamoyltransferase